MNFKTYYKLTKEVTYNCLNICGVIFTPIFAVIFIITEYKEASFVELIRIFILFFLLGNAFGIFIWALSITFAYKQTKSSIKFFNSIPDEIKEKFGLRLVEKPRNPKYNFLQLEILDTKSEQSFFFNFYNKYVCITILNDLNEVVNFQKRLLKIQNKYKKDQIVLTGWGLRKNIKKKDWYKITSEEINLILEKLRIVSDEENFKIINRKTK